MTTVDAWVYAPCECTGRNGKVHVTFSAHARWLCVLCLIPCFPVSHSALCACCSLLDYWVWVSCSNNNNINLHLLMVLTNRSTLHTVYNIQKFAAQGSNDTIHRLSNRTAATTRFSPEGIGCQKQTAPRFCQHPIRWAFASQAFTRWCNLSTHPINRPALSKRCVQDPFFTLTPAVELSSCFRDHSRLRQLLSRI